MPVISVPKSFFVSERNTVYGEWGSAFWRELLSNSLDADAGQIAIRGRFTPEGNFRIDFLDNGKGMDRQVIEDVYMRLGESTKRGGSDDGIGGFGRARILTCFSHQFYQIRTQDLLVTGNGASYEIKQLDTAVKGCAISIEMEPEHAWRVSRGLQQVLRQSSLRAGITIDMPAEGPAGQRLADVDPAHFTPTERGQRFSGWSHKGRSFRILEDEKGTWGQVYVARGSTAVPHSAVVRVNGMAMYADHIRTAAQVTIDLVPERAREILTASRDSIRSPFRDEIQQLYAEIAADSRSVFRERGRQPETAIASAAAGASSFGIRDLRRARGGVTEPVAQPFAAPPAAGDDMPDRTDERKAGRAPGEAEQVSRRSDPTLRLPFVLHINNPSSEQRSASNRFRPETMEAKGGIGQVAELIHTAWNAACMVAIRALDEAMPYAFEEDDRWVTGFVFDKEMRACHMKTEAARHTLLLNPVDEHGRLAFRISDPASMKELTALAMHEVSHCVSKWHDERFVSAFTDIVSRVRDVDMERAMRSELDITRDWIRQRRERRPQSAAELAGPDL